MSLPESMSREEMLELAQLDALGLLDEFESQAFNRYFHRATAALQEEIRALQAVIAADTSLLPAEEPVDTLGPRVVRAVKDSVAAEQAALAPIASIGPRRQFGAGHDAGQGMELMEARLVQQEARADAMRWTRSARTWRAASFVLGGLFLVSMYFNALTSRQAVVIGQLALNASTHRELARKIRARSGDLIENASVVRGMAPARGGVNGSATAYVDRRGNAFVLALGLMEDAGPYTIRVVDEKGVATTVATFEVHQPVTAVRIDHADGMQLAFARLEILDATGAVVLRT